MAGEDVPLDDIVVTVSHPYQDIEVALRDWIRMGPGPRYLVRPTAAKHRVTGVSLSLTVIPLQYRNDHESRRLIREGKLANPWPEQAEYPEKYFGKREP